MSLLIYKEGGGVGDRKVTSSFELINPRYLEWYRPPLDLGTSHWHWKG